jgi:hypothetical protein
MKQNMGEKSLIHEEAKNNIGDSQIFFMFAPLKKGRVAERLGRGLQNLVQRFKSARDLNTNILSPLGEGMFCF